MHAVNQLSLNLYIKEKRLIRFIKPKILNCFAKNHKLRKKPQKIFIFVSLIFIKLN